MPVDVGAAEKPVMQGYSLLAQGSAFNEVGHLRTFAWKGCRSQGVLHVSDLWRGRQHLPVVYLVVGTTEPLYYKVEDNTLDKWLVLASVSDILVVLRLHE